jgi:hypothetical protein
MVFMSNYSLSLGESLRYGNQLLTGLLRPLSFCLLAMSLTRFLIFFLSRVHFADVPVLETLMAFWIGFRFDLLILGFVLMPVALLHTAFGLLRFWPALTARFVLVYLSFVWALLTLDASFEALFFVINQRHANAVELFEASESLVTEAYSLMGSTTLTMFLAIMVCLLFLGVRGFFRQERRMTRNVEFPYEKVSTSELVLRLVAPLFFVALAARGTVTAHHLEKAHSQFSSWDIANQLALNSAWVSDKETQDR